jgi:hypothetical protein
VANASIPTNPVLEPCNPIEGVTVNVKKAKAAISSNKYG